MTAPRPRGAGQGGRTLRQLRRSALVIGLAALVAGCGVQIGGDTGELPQNALDPAGPFARELDNLWNIVFPIAVVVFIFVQGAILFIAFRFRSRGGETGPPKQVAGNTRLEVIWTIIPALILAGIAVPTVQTIFSIAGEPEGALEVRVVGKQYWWEFEYLGDEGQGVITANELHIPTGRPVRLLMESRASYLPDPGGGENMGTDAAGQAVIHSFWVPRLAGKQDVMPGHTRPLTLEADEPGRYPGQCAEYCGLSHSRMRFVVEAHEPADFEAWLQGQAQPAADDLTGLAAEGQTAVDEAGCLACHAISGHPGDQGVRIAPDLTHFATRQTFAGAIFDTENEDELRAWLRDPPGVKAGAQMPRGLVTDANIDAIVEYLQSLQ